MEIIQSMCGKEIEVYIQCKDCEYSTDNFYVFGKHTYRNHRESVSKDNKETVVAMISVSVQTESVKRKDFEKFNEEMVKVEKKEAAVQTKPEL